VVQDFVHQQSSTTGALALWLFDSSRRELPDGYEANDAWRKNNNDDTKGIPKKI